MEYIELTQETRPACIWMQAGVVPKKECRQEYACTTCRFDRAMNHVVKENENLRARGIAPTSPRTRLESWKDRLCRQPLAKRPCIHHMKGKISFKACPKAYHCVDCEFDQYFHDQYKVHTILKPVGFEDIAGVSLPAGFYLHPGHTWIKIEDQGMVRMGLDDFSAKLLGEFDRLEAPLMGKPVEQGKPAVTLSRQGNSVSFLSPVNGVVMEVNDRVRKNPGLLNQSPYTDGWIFVLHCPDLKQDLKQLMFMDGSTQFMETEVDRLFGFLEQTTQVCAADGGSLVDDIYGNLPGVPWEALVEKFIPQGE